MAMRASQLGKHLARGVKQACLGAQENPSANFGCNDANRWLDP